MAQAGVQLNSTGEEQYLSQVQQDVIIAIASQSNAGPKPCPDLLNGTRKEYIGIAIPLYEASIRGDWKSAKEILDKRPELVRYSITGNDETALHVAASTKSTKQDEEFVENLMTYMEKSDLELENKSSKTALCLAAAAGNINMVKIMMEKNRALVAITGSNGMNPLYMAVLFGHYEVVKYLYRSSGKLHDDWWRPENRGWILQKCVENDMFDIALDILLEHPQLSNDGNVLGVLARKTDIFAEKKSSIISRTIDWVIRPNMQAQEKERKTNALEILKTIWHNIAEKPRDEIDNILRGPPDFLIMPASDKEDQTLQLLKLISDNIIKMQKNKNPVATTFVNGYVPRVANAYRQMYSSRVLFVATKVGNTKFVVELLRLYPDLAWKVNDDNQSIFHIAARHRHVDIYNLLHEIVSNKDLITPLKEHRTENNMLHIVAKSVERKRLEEVSGGAFQMQRELLWFKEVQQMIPPSYREQKNKDGLTPQELFTREHKDLVKEGEEWMKGTASQCIVVAVLIATIVITAAFTVPGGYDQNDGIPLFIHKVSFVVFIVADAISLFSSSASIFTFLSILTSRYAEYDFLTSIPKKLMIGVVTLYISIITMILAFSVTFFVLYSKDQKWIPIVVTMMAPMPVLLFAVLQYRLIIDVIHSTYGSTYLFRPKKRVLYSENYKSNHRRFPFTIPFISRGTPKLSKLL